MDADLRAYLAAVSDADAGGAIAVLDGSVAAGATTSELIREVLVPAQHEVGERWFSGAWSVADEHAATAVSEQALALLARPTARRAAATRVVVACAPGEWHSLPARLATELARQDDLDLVFLGASMPATDLQKSLRTRGADALALSATMATSLIGAVASITAAHAEGIPVVVGGRAWGRGQKRAAALGADLRLSDPTRLPEALAGLAHQQFRSDVHLLPEVLLMDVPSDELLLLALERQAAASARVRQLTALQRQQTLQDLRWLTRHAAATVACDDSTVLAELLTWLLALLEPRGFPASAVLDGCRYLADALEPEAPQCAAALHAEAEAVRDQDDAGRRGSSPA